jgi:hypothetical protein
MRIDDNYTINCDGNGCSLLFEEQRDRLNKKTGEQESYTFKSQWHYLSVPQCLRKYTELSIETSKDLKDVLNKLEEINTTINQIK